MDVETAQSEVWADAGVRCDRFEVRAITSNSSPSVTEWR